MEEPEIEIAIRSKSYLMIRGAGDPCWITEAVPDVMAKLDAASDSEMVEFTCLTMLGQAHDPKWEPMAIWVERASIYGVGAITKAKWDDRLADLRESAMVPRMSMGGLALPGA